MGGLTTAAMALVLQLMAPLTGFDESPHVARFDHTPEEVFCLAQNMFWEARNQSQEGRLAVAFVTLNRVRSKAFPDTICAVVWQRKQFSWTHDGKSDKIPRQRVDDGMWGRTVQAALRALSPYTDDPTNGALFYHADYVDPVWAKGMQIVLTIEDHKFYRKGKR